MGASNIQYRAIGLLILAALFPTSSGAEADAGRIDKLELIGLAKDREFAALESALGGYWKDFEDGRRSEGNLVFAFDAFEYSDPDLEPNLRDWVDAWPASASAALALGTYYAHLGGLSRGERRGSETSAAAFAEMHRYFDLARPLLRKAIDLEPRLAPAHLTLIFMERSAGNRADIADLHRAATEALPDSSRIPRAYIASRMPNWGGSVQEVLRLLAELHEKHGDDPAYAWIKSYALHVAASELDHHDAAQAAELYDKAVAASNDAGIRIERADFLRRHGRDEEAVVAFRELFDEGFESVGMHQQIGQAYRMLGYRRLALDHFNRALELDPYNPKSLRLRAGIYIDIGQPQIAEADYEKARTYAEHQAFMHEMRGYLYSLYMPNKISAIDAWRAASRLAPDNRNYLLRLAATLHQNRDCEVFEVYERYLGICASGRPCSSDQEFAFPGLLQYMDCPEPAVPN